MATTFELTKDSAKSIILSRSIINEADGDVQVVNATVTSSNYVDSLDKHLVSFDLTTKFLFKHGVDLWKNDDLQDATNTNLTMSLLPNMTAPQKGDICKVVVKRVKCTKYGDIMDFRPQRVIVKEESATISAKDMANAFETE